jgi:outer membrane receptor for ferrienterochelin and colicin
VKTRYPFADRRSEASRLAVAVACVCACSQPARAAAQPSAPVAQAEQPAVADLSLEDLLKLKVETVFGASRVVQEITHAPASVSVITREEIRTHGYRTLADVLRNVRGFYVTNDRNYSYVGVRGFARPGDYNCRVLVLVNGHRLNDTIFEGALLGTESPLDVALFERVEVIRGPSSSVYGTSAFFGVVNLVTRPGGSLNGAEAEAQFGSETTRSGRVTVGGRMAGGVEGLASVTGFATDGNRRLYYPEFDDGAVGAGIAHDADADASRNAFASASAGPLQLQAGFGSRRKTIPTGPFDTMFDDPGTRTRDARTFVDLQFTHRFRPRTTVLLRAAYDHYEYDGRYAYEAGPFTDNARGAWVTTEATGVRRFQRHALTAGIEYRNNLRQNQSAADETGVLLDDHRSSQTVAVYAEDEFGISSKVLLNAGLRFDDYCAGFGSTVNPRMALIVSPFDTTTVKVLYGRAFRAPNPYELYYDENLLSATLGPERISTREIVAEQRIGARVQVTASLFQNHVRDLITQRSGSDETLDGLYYQNLDGVTATGAELELQTELPGHLRTRVAYAHGSTHDTATRLRISNSPAQVATVVLDAPVAHTGIIAAFNGHYIGERRTVNDARVPRTFVADATLSRLPSRRGLELSASLHNLFNASYGDPGSVEHRQQIIVQDGRTIRVRATWHY